MTYQLISLAGAIMILSAYGAHQMRRIHAETVLYQFLNFAGGALLFATAIAGRQLGFILREGSWTLLSAAGRAS